MSISQLKPRDPHLPAAAASVTGLARANLQGSIEQPMPATPPLSRTPPLPLSYDEPLGQKIIELHVWAVSEGLRGTEAAQLFDGFCQRLVDAGVPLWWGLFRVRTFRT